MQALLLHRDTREGKDRPVFVNEAMIMRFQQTGPNVNPHDLSTGRTEIFFPNSTSMVVNEPVRELFDMVMTE